MKRITIYLSLIILALSVIISSCKKKPDNGLSINNQTFSVDENSLNGTVVGEILGDSLLEYSITAGNLNDAFEISKNKIIVKNTDALDFETTPLFKLSMEGKDKNDEKGGFRAEVNLNNIDPPLAGMILYLPFDGNIIDHSGYSNNGIDDLSPNTYVAGKKSQALDFNGITDYITLTNTLDSYNGLSFSFWLKTRGANGAQNNGAIIGKYSKSNDTRCFLVYSFGSYATNNTNRLSAAFYTYGYSSAYHDMTKSFLDATDLAPFPFPALWTISHPTYLTVGEWTHCVVNLTASAVEVYLNGVLCTKKTREWPSYATSGSEPVTIGNVSDMGEGSNNHFNGVLDELRVYNRGLTAGEIRTLFKE